MEMKERFENVKQCLLHAIPSYTRFDEQEHALVKQKLIKDSTNSLLCVIPETKLPILSDSSYFTIILFFHKSKIHIGKHEITCMPFNLVIMKEGTHYQIKLEKPTDTVFIFDYSSDYFDSLLMTQIAECPIFYDMLTLNEAQNEYLLFDYLQDEMIFKTLELLASEWIHRSGEVHTARNCKLLLVILLSQLNRDHTRYLLVTSSSMLRDNERGKILKYISDNLTSVTLTSTAEHFNYHPAYFSSLFKKLFYVSFSEKCITLKLEHAKRLFLTTDLSAHQIMERSGFKDKSYFYKCFKARYQMTPNQYRKSYQNLYK